jgi:hypothetical protein
MRPSRLAAILLAGGCVTAIGSLHVVLTALAHAAPARCAQMCRQLRNGVESWSIDN